MDQKQGNQYLGFVLHLIGVIVMAIAIMISMEFWLSNTFLSGLYTLLSLLVLVGIVHLLVFLKTNKRYQRKMKKLEKLFLIPYFVFILVTFIPFTHFINIELNLRGKVIDNVTKDLTQLSSIFEDYQGWKETIKVNYEEDISINTGISKSKKTAMVTALELSIQEEYAIIESKVESLLDKSERNLKKWNAFSLENIQLKYDTQIHGIIESMEKASDSHPYTKDNPFSVHYTPSSPIILNRPRDSLRVRNIAVATPLFLLTHLMIIVPYIFARRPGWYLK